MPEFDTYSLPPTQSLVLEVLAARARLGETCWTFSTRHRPALEALTKRGLLWWQSGIMPYTCQAFLTDTGREAVLSDTYEVPDFREAENAALSGETSVYRCAECGHGRHLFAWAGSLIHGPLGIDGHLAAYGEIREDWLHEDSIDCSRHPGEMIEKFEGGNWCRWWVCPQCKGKDRPAWNACRGPGLPPEPGTYGERHEGWRPVEHAASAREDEP